MCSSDLDGGQKRPTQCRTERVTETGFEGPDGELLTAVVLFAEGFDLGPLYDEHADLLAGGGDYLL